MKKLLVPTDFSKCSDYALKTAADIAKNTDGEIHILHVFERPVYGFVDLSYDKEQSQLVNEQLDYELNKIVNQDYLEGLTIHKHIIHDKSLAEAILDPIFDDIDLVIMGTTGAHGISGIFPGSNTERVLRTAEVPVLSIREYHHEFDPRDIIFASSFYGETETPFIPVKTFADFFNAKIHLLKIVTPGNFETTTRGLKIMEQFAAKSQLVNFTINLFNADSIESGILSFAYQHQIDLIATETHKRTAIQNLFHHSMSTDLSTESTFPVLTIPINPVPANTKILFPELK